MTTSFRHPLPPIPNQVVQVSFPADHVMQLSMNRPKQYNAMNSELEKTMDTIFDWFEREPTLYVAVLASTNKKAWCAGQDLKELAERRKTMANPRMEKGKNSFGGISTRYTKKPIIGAINGFAMGGGSEMVVNLDMAVAGENAIFGFPEVKRGVTIGAGGVPRLVRIVGHQKAMELCLTGREISAKEAQSLGFVTKVVPDDEVDKEAVRLATSIASNSPDSIRVLVQAIRLSQEHGSVDRAYALNQMSAEWDALWEGENLQIGLQAFAERKTPQWIPSKL